MNKFTIFVSLILFLAIQPILSRVLIVVENNYYSANSDKVTRYAHELLTFENTKSSIVIFTNPTTGTHREKCSALWHVIKNQCQSDGDVEGAVLVGELPEPIAFFENSSVAIDYFYMDILNAETGMYYNSDYDIWTTDTMEMIDRYNNVTGDGVLDIWVSHIFAHRLPNIRRGLTVLTEYEVINEYFDRLHDRMIGAANVPKRGFAMSGITDWNYTIDDVLNFSNLNLENYFEFTHPFNTPYHWMAQLQSGPKGNSNNGSFNGTRYPNERNVKNCISDYRIDAFTGQTIATDTNGYEWAGLFEHSAESKHNFNSFHNAGSKTPVMNGVFKHVTYSGMLGSNDQLQSGGYDGNYYLYNNNNAEPSWYTDGFLGWNKIWRDVTAYFQMLVIEAGEYEIEIYYEANPDITCDENNGVKKDDSLKIYISAIPPNANFLINNPVALDSIKICQGTHTITGSNWEPLGKYNFDLNYSALVKLEINGHDGDVIIDAVRFTRVSDGTQFVVDNNDTGFVSSSWIDRSFWDMQDESPNHDAYSKVNFFLINGCHAVNYVQNLTMGVLYGMTHNGLICIGPSPNGHLYDTYDLLTKALSDGYSFGDSYLQQYRNFRGSKYSARTIIGAGTLKAEPFEKFGTQMAYSSNLTVSDTQTVTHKNKVLVMDHLNVPPSGNCTASAKKIRLFSETRLQGYTRIVAN